MGRSLDGAVVVITGGSSGIGRCAALKVARSGSRVVLAGREQRAFTETVAACLAGDGQAIAVRTDVRQESDVDACAQEAIDTFGQIDVWVNGAGVISYGRFEDVPSEVFRGVIETNLMGHVHGSRAAIRRFREQGQGTLVNLASVWGG